MGLAMTLNFRAPDMAVQRALTFLMVTMALSILAAPLAGIEAAHCALITIIGITGNFLILFVKLAIKVFFLIRRSRTPAGRKNEEIMSQFITDNPSMKDVLDEINTLKTPLMWAHCVEFRKRVYKGVSRSKGDEFLARLERLGII